MSETYYVSIGYHGELNEIEANKVLAAKEEWTPFYHSIRGDAHPWALFGMMTLRGELPFQATTRIRGILPGTNAICWYLYPSDEFQDPRELEEEEEEETEQEERPHYDGPDLITDLLGVLAAEAEE